MPERTVMRPALRRSVLLLPLAVISSACTPAATSAPKPAVDAVTYAADTREWRAKRLDAIAGTDGWSTLAGLFWLDSTRYSIGSDSSSGIVLPSRAVPRALGTLTRQDSVVRFVAARGAVVLRDSTRIDSLVVQSDKSKTPTVLRSGSMTLRLIERGGRLAIRAKDSMYVTRREFAGLDYYPLDTSLRVQARLIPHATPRTLKIVNVIGQTDDYRSPGILEFSIAGASYRLTAAHEPNDTLIFVIFRDGTAKDATYPAGRFMYANPADSAGNVILDFNRAFNPPCAFTVFATCPLPPAENMLTVAIRAGEKRYAGAHGGTVPGVVAGAR
jgi:uncharacterized protein